MFKVLICVLSAIVLTVSQECTEESTLTAVRKPIYDFSVRFLDRLAIETTGHFVYSPLSTWLQLLVIARGAKSKSLHEILNVIGLKGYRKKSCYRRKLVDIINNLEENLTESERSSVVIVDKYYPVKAHFKREVEALVNARLLALDFDNPERSANIVNEIIKEETDGAVEDVLLPDDFDNSILLMTDAAYFKNAWHYPFNEAQTRPTTFYSHEGIPLGNVNMMNQIGYFKYVEVPLINAKVLELPCEDDRVSMLVFLPIKGDIKDLFYNLQQTTLTGILNLLKVEVEKPVNVSLPRFNINTEITNVVELLYDMGVRRIFYPDKAELKGISDYTINVSFMTQLTSIEVTEKYVAASAGPESLINEVAKDFNADKPFGYTVIDWRSEFIMYAGMYSEPSLD